MPEPPELLLRPNADFCRAFLIEFDSADTAVVVFISATTVNNGYNTVRLMLAIGYY